MAGVAWHAVRVPELTLLFTDVEGSTQLVERHGAAGTDALIRHHALIREASEAQGGRLFERIGDAAYAVFPDPAAAVSAAVDIQRRLSGEDWGPVGSIRVRMALDTGELQERDGRFFGRGLHRCARIQSLARGGETLLSDETARRVADRLPADYRLRDLGHQKLRGLADAVRVWGVVQAPAVERGAEERPQSPTTPIRVLLVDDYEVVRRGLRGFLELLPEIEIVGEAANGREAVDAAYRLQPAVILMDLVMPEMDGPQAIAAIRERQPEIAILALTSFAEPERIRAALEAGAVGHLTKDAEAEEVAAAVRAAYAGRLASA
jgi:class 3 adenylate cyclase/CheY-like chemotaxis protein